MLYMDPKHLGSIKFDVWNSFHHHAAIRGPKQPFLARVRIQFESFLRDAIVSDSANLSSCMFVLVLSARMCFSQ